MPIRAAHFFSLLAAAGLLAAAAAPVVAESPPESATTAARAPAGPTGPAITLYNGTYLRGHDVIASAAGTFVVWASSDHRISVCGLQGRATSCAGGVRSIDALGDPDDVELALDAVGRPTAVWMYDTPASVSGPMGAKLATATIQPDGSVSAATVVADAPSFGELYGVSRAPDGRIWAVVLPRAGSTSLMVYPGLGSPITVPTPYYPGDGKVEFTGPVDGVLAIHQYGSISGPISAAPLRAGAFGGFSSIRGTWSGQGFAMVKSSRGIELVASRNNASYETVVARWNGSAFGAARRTGQTRCTATSHDLVTDTSGRLVDAFGSACGTGVANLAKGVASGVATWSPGGTPYATPQVATSARGTGWVAWGVNGDGAAFEKLVVAPITLPATPGTRSAANPAARARLTGIQGCMPPSTAKVKLVVRPKKGWRVRSKKLTFDGRATSRIKGAALAPTSSHRLKGTAVLVRNGSVRSISVAMVVRACGP